MSYQRIPEEGLDALVAIANDAARDVTISGHALLYIRKMLSAIDLFGEDGVEDLIYARIEAWANGSVDPLEDS